mmetsp:Transcript_95856/g.253331  ORF Transcript_95856/g.253331 Transcript_95856/m.253331 type:complete len:128 (-) Transcript_95856:1026-1409(-)
MRSSSRTELGSEPVADAASVAPPRPSIFSPCIKASGCDVVELDSRRPRAEIFTTGFASGPSTFRTLFSVPGHAASMPAPRAGTPLMPARMRMIAEAQLDPIRIPMAFAQWLRAEDKKDEAENKLNNT